MQIENKQYDDWEEWSRKTVVEQMQRNAAFAGEAMNVEEELIEEVAGDETPGASVFAAEEGRQAALGRRAKV